MFLLDKINNLPLSIKTKTMVLVLALFILMSSLFSILRYLDVKQSIDASRDDFKEQILNIYNTTLNRVEKFYINRAHANIESYGIRESLKSQNAQKLKKLSQERWNVLKEENPSLINMKFYSASKEKLVLLGEENANTLMDTRSEYLEPSVDFIFSGYPPSYHILVPVFEQKTIIGYVEFSLLVEYFLNEIEDFSKLKGFIIPEEISQNPRNMQNSINKELVTPYLQNHTYVKHVIELNSLKEKSKSELLFLQDITTQQQTLVDALYETLFLSLGMLTVMTIVLNYGFEVLIEKLEKSENSLRILNHTLEERVSEEINKRYEQERMLMHQSRLASMGEMIGNIAHQWRQPLTDLGSILINISFMYDVKKLTSEIFQERLQKAESLILYMSKTIDDFRNFFANKTIKEDFCVVQAIEKALNLIESALKNHHISLVFDEKKSCIIQGYPNQFAQAILNILGNAKDVLLERETSNPFVKIEVFCDQDTTTVCISDNGGGIQISPIEKIFEPYVSTKHAIAGTGIGLYMSKTIIEKNLHGKLEAFNTPNGAMFTIKLPNKIPSQSDNS